MMFISTLCLIWKCGDKKCTYQETEMSAPLEYWKEPSTYLKIPIKKILSNKTTSSPVVLLGPGIGKSNLPHDISTFSSSFPDFTFYLIGYRGIDSDQKLNENYVKTLSTMETSKITEKKLSQIANKTLKNVNISEFWLPQRARDIVEVLKEENIPQVNLLTIGETGSLIGLHLMSDFPEYIDRAVVVSPAVPANHSDCGMRLLGRYRRICRRDPNCPYRNIKWLPSTIPERLLMTVKINPDRIYFLADAGLRSPTMVPQALELIKGINDESKVALFSFQAMVGPELMSVNWLDAAMHACAVDADPSTLVPGNIKKICPYLPQLFTLPRGKITNPVFVFGGELDVPKPEIAVSFYRNMSISPSLVSNYTLLKATSRYYTARPDISAQISNFLANGSCNFNNIEEVHITWVIGFSMIWAMRIGIGVMIVAVLIISIVMFSRESKSKRRQKERVQLAREFEEQQKLKEKGVIDEPKAKPKKQQKQKAKKE